MNLRSVIINQMTLRLSKGWQGDPVYLARKIAEQVQAHASGLTSTENMDVKVQGSFSGNAARAGQELSRRLQSVTRFRRYEI